MNFFNNLSTRKNSVNSSLATIKGLNFQESNQTINKNRSKSKKRFSHQQNIEPIKLLQRNSSYKQNTNSDLNDSNCNCNNHQNTQATHCVLQNSTMPLFYCERCAILIASQGFSVTSIKNQSNKENIMGKQNINRLSFTQNVQKEDRCLGKNLRTNEKQNLNQTQPMHKKRVSHNIKQVVKIPLSHEVISDLQHCWLTLQSTRRTNLAQIDVLINELSQSIDSLQDYFYVLHQYIEKQKNIQLRKIVSKRQVLQKIRFQTSDYFVKKLLTVKQLKQIFMSYGQCEFEKYKNCVHNNDWTAFEINFEGILNQRDFIQNLKSNNVHIVGQQITKIINENFDFLEGNKGRHIQEKKRNQVHRYDHRPFHTNRNNHQKTSSFNHIDSDLSTQHIASNYQQNHPQFPPHIYTTKLPSNNNNVQSSVRSLQLSFDNSENDSQDSPRVVTEKQETNNFTLNQYLNQNTRGEDSYVTNLLLTSTDLG